ncbi:GIY-YIG nuclease family protein [Paraburkholderia dipogonis]|uniref:GIY-YIG nuclease family protein n=1 Tax=Paraburkholderia dipogonis TaxID=1211383 RepID=UPI0038BB3232
MAAASAPKASAYDFAGVYTITAPDGRVYVGASTHVGNRWKSHRTLGRRGKHHNPALQESFTRYGVGAHRFEVVERVRRGAPLASRQGSFHFDGNLGGREYATIRSIDPAKLMNCPSSRGRRIGMLTSERREKINASKVTKLTESAVISIKTALRDRAGEDGLNEKLAREHGVPVRPSAASNMAVRGRISRSDRPQKPKKPPITGGFSSFGRSISAELLALIDRLRTPSVDVGGKVGHVNASRALL